MNLLLILVGLIVAHLCWHSCRIIYQLKQLFRGYRLFGAKLLSAIFPHQNKGELFSVNTVVVVHTAESSGIGKNGDPDVTLHHPGRIRLKPLALELEVGV